MTLPLALCSSASRLVGPLSSSLGHAPSGLHLKVDGDFPEVGRGRQRRPSGDSYSAEMGEPRRPCVTSAAPWTVGSHDTSHPSAMLCRDRGHAPLYCKPAAAVVATNVRELRASSLSCERSNHACCMGYDFTILFHKHRRNGEPINGPRRSACPEYNHKTRLAFARRDRGSRSRKAPPREAPAKRSRSETIR